MSNGNVTDPRTQTEVHPDVVAAYANPGPGSAFWAPHGSTGGGAMSGQPGPWTPLTLSGANATTPCQYRKEAGNVVRLSGVVQSANGNGSSFASGLPLPFDSGATLFFASAGTDAARNSQMWMLSLNPSTGNLNFTKPADQSSGGTLCLDGIVYVSAS